MTQVFYHLKIILVKVSTYKNFIFKEIISRRTNRLSRYIGLRKSGFKNELFDAKEFFYMNFDFKNGCKIEFDDNNEKSCS